MTSCDAVVVGSGPNGLAAAITLAQAGLSVRVFEGAEQIGGGARSAYLTLPSFVHDVCSAVHPLAVVSPFFAALPLSEHGLHWIFPPAFLAHPLDRGRCVVVQKDFDQSTGLGADRHAYERLFEPLLKHAPELFNDALGPVKIPRHPLVALRFGLKAIRSAIGLVGKQFKEEAAKALFAGVAAHSFLRLSEPLSSAAGLMLTLAGHAAGWPVPRGGSQQISNALASYLRSLGGEISVGNFISRLEDLPSASLFLLDVGPQQLMSMCGDRLPRRFAERLRSFRRAPGVFKMDWALDGPVPWQAPECARAATVHLGATLDEIALSEALIHLGKHPERPFVLLAQPSLFDGARTPEGKHTLWAYCHVPNGSTVDMSARIESQITRFAPGFRDRILARHLTFPADLQRNNPNCIGGDISGGSVDWRQLFARPVSWRHPYRTHIPGVYLCSSSTPPGPGVHGLCGHHAALAALRDLPLMHKPLGQREVF